ncbi:MAG TPA: peptidyl-prolyl cis-trans isomerase [Bacteroidetes bacterium]|nr:peptidyl-prolyl cis-trans isomerase [Bacteroidota bacterium]
MAKIVEDFSKAKDIFQFALTNSDSRSLDTSLKAVQFLPKAVLPILGNTDTVIGPLMGENGISLYRIARIGEDSVNFSLDARHILVRIAGSTAEDSATAKSKAQDILRRVNAGNFTEIAAAESEDPLTKDKGGNLGWIGSTDLGPQFAEAMADASVGSFKIAETTQGYHVVEVLNRTNKLYTVAEILRDISISTATKDSIFKRASGYHGRVLSGSDFDEAITDFAEARTQTSGRVTPGEFSLLGLKGARPIIAWAFKNEEGFINDEILESENAFVIARIQSKGKKGFRSLEEVHTEIEDEVRKHAKAKFILAKLNGNNSDMAATAAAYGEGATAGTATDVRFSNNFVQNIGNEPKVVGRTFGLKQGEVSKPIIGNNGVYLVKLDVLNASTPLVDAAIAMQRQAIQQAKIQKAVNAAYQGMIDIADVRDMRYKFDN